MGAAPSKPLVTPARPFDRQQRRVCFTNAFIAKAQKDAPSVLLQLISCREWQKVLIRVNLFPTEITQPQKMSWYGVQWSLLPLHLACALQPPQQVIAMLLHFNADTGRVCMNRSRVKTKKRFLLRRKKMNKPFIPFTTREFAAKMDLLKNDTAPSSDSGVHVQQHDVTHLGATIDSVGEDEHGPLLEGGAQEEQEFAMEGDALFRVLGANEDNIFLVFEPSETTDSDDDPSLRTTKFKRDEYEDNQVCSYDDKTAETSKNALQEYLGTNGLVLQLGYHGTVESLAIDSLPSQPTRMQWNLDPLLMEADTLLPLHIACLYRAAPQIIALLLEAYPEGVAASALGMLPIHMVCAGFDLPTPVVAPPSQVPFPIEDEFDLAKSLAHLVKAFPESLDYPSENNGMTPEMYIEETMDDGSYTNVCLQVLGVTSWENSSREKTSLSEHDGTDSSSYTTREPIPTEVHCDDGTSSALPSIQTQTSSRTAGDFSTQINGQSGTPLYAKMAAKEWEAALDMIEEHSDQGSEWQYGIELDHIESHGNSQLWKRLPIHSACVLGAPVGVVEALHLAYPKGVATKDPFTGALPLHLACRHSAPPDLVKGLLMAYPIGTRVADGVGRLALHHACLSGAPRLTFTYLLKAYPHAVLLKDDKCKTPLQYAETNPTVKRATVELLELVHYFLDKLPTVEDDYKFSGFHSPRQIQKGSVVSRFFEEEEESVMGTIQSRADDDLKKVVLIGTESARENEGKQQSGSDGHLEKHTRVHISGTLKDRGQSESIICLDCAPRSVTSFSKSTPTDEKEVTPWDPIIFPGLENECVNMLQDNVAMHTEDSDEKAGGAHLNSKGVHSSTVEDEKIHSTSSSSDELLANESFVADDHVIEADKEPGCSGWSSRSAPAAADHGTKKAREAAVSIASYNDESKRNKNAAESKISWLEASLLARVANAHKRAEPVESVIYDDSNALCWHCNSSKSSPIPVEDEQNGTFTNELTQSSVHPKLTYPLDSFIAVNQIDKTDLSSNEFVNGARSITSAIIDELGPDPKTSLLSESPASCFVPKRKTVSFQGESIAHTKDSSALDLGEFISLNQIDKTGLSSDEASTAESNVASNEMSTSDESGLDPKTSTSSESAVTDLCLVQERDDHISPTHSQKREGRLDLRSW